MASEPADPSGADRWRAIEVAHMWLGSIETQRHTVREQLRELGCIRSDDIVGDFGEWLASCYYDAALEASSNRGFDLRTGVKRIEVKTLRSDRYRRGSMGRLTAHANFTHLLAIRLDKDFRPETAYEIPRETIEAHSRGGRMGVTVALQSAEGVSTISADELIAAAGRRLTGA
jgi:hypothetical protein